eukprot:GEMP01036583.1.p1 GENE.GEMP01036583.1~~GEMP01036583.1.p1  ORF type:complete len:471 (+),score=131.34 GEMP01036583.1:90-1502(+)
MVDVRARYLNGDEVLLRKCSTLDDARVKFASLHDRLAPEVLFLTLNDSTPSESPHSVLSFPDATDETAEKPPVLPVNAIFQYTPQYTEELLQNAVILHAQSHDRRGIERAMRLCASDDDAQHMCARALLQYLRADSDCVTEVLELLSALTTPNAINAENEDQWTSLDLACFLQSDDRVVRILLDAGADASHIDRRGRTALARTAYQGKGDLVDVLLTHDKTSDDEDGHGGRDSHARGKLVNRTDVTKYAPLCLAAVQGHVQICAALLRHKAEINHAQVTGLTAVSQASYGGHIDVVELLLENRADCNIATNNGRTPLIIAAREGHFHVVLALLRHGADLHYVNNVGCGALSLAASSGHALVCEELIKHGANVNAVNNVGWSPLMMAVRRVNSDKVVDVLLRSRADVTVRDRRGWQALCLAHMHNREDIVQKLREHGAYCGQAKHRISHQGHDEVLIRKNIRTTTTDLGRI